MKSQFAGKTILIVDDESDLREILASDLQSRGAKTLEAGNGKEALEIVKAQNVDAVISDIRMPGGNGVELLDKLKEMDVNRPVVLLMTGFSDLTEADAYSSGAEAILSKPFDRNELYSTLLRCIWPPRHRWKPVESSTAPTVELRFKLGALEECTRARILNLGRGGMFVRMERDIPPRATSVTFDIVFDPGDPKHLAGTGVVRWVRLAPEGDLPPGCAVEFISLDSACLEEVIAWIEKSGTRAFIPKG